MSTGLFYLVKQRDSNVLKNFYQTLNKQQEIIRKCENAMNSLNKKSKEIEINPMLAICQCLNTNMLT